MTTPTPSPENGYTVASTMTLTAELFNAILGSIHARLTAREALEATFEALIAQGTSAALTLVQVNVAPQLAALQQQITDAAAAVGEIIDNGAAPNSLKFAGEFPAFYLDPANFSTAGFIRTLLASVDEEAARTALGVRSEAESDSAIAAAVAAAIDALLDGTPGALDTLNELAAALGDDPNFATTVATSIAAKLNLSGGTMTGPLVLAALTAAAGGATVAGLVGVEPYDYGNLSAGDITLDPATRGLGGKITRDNTSNNIIAPAGTPTRTYTMVIDIVGTSSTGSPGFVGFDNTDFGDDMPGAGQTATLYVKVSPTSKKAKIEADNY